MLKIIPTEHLKIIPWRKEDNSILLKGTKARILFVGLGRYLRGVKQSKKRGPGRYHQGPADTFAQDIRI